jgi:hypothetical protein
MTYFMLQPFYAIIPAVSRPGNEKAAGFWSAAGIHPDAFRMNFNNFPSDIRLHLKFVV